MFVLLAIMLVPTVRAYLKQQHDLAELHAQLDAQRASVSALEDENRRWQDPAYVEQQARDRLKFVRPGEKAYQVIGAEKLLGDRLTGRATVVNPSAGDDSVPWYGRMWSSVVIADRMDTGSVDAPVSPIGGEDVLPADPAAPPAPTGSSTTSGADGVENLP
ncbi:FtsB family cell division protein [Agilicoccus flavus]|uniref:FtsB family cell division protein n=1 Tax=Agilicoccus flavus TaxID=2775968 RepID=UPI0027DA4A8C|nr:septum formation initiator family protein [Agilicoccus flavus]